MANESVGAFITRLRRQEASSSTVPTNSAVSHTTPALSGSLANLADYLSDGSEAALSPVLPQPVDEETVRASVPSSEFKSIAVDPVVVELLDELIQETEEDAAAEQRAALAASLPTHVTTVEINESEEDELDETADRAALPSLSEFRSVNTENLELDEVVSDGDPLLSLAAIALSDTTEPQDGELSIELSVASTPMDGEQLFAECSAPLISPTSSDLRGVFANEERSHSSASTVSTGISVAVVIPSTVTQPSICTLPPCVVRLEKVPTTQPELDQFIAEALEKGRPSKKGRRLKSASRIDVADGDVSRKKPVPKAVHFSKAASSSQSAPSTSGREKMTLKTALRGLGQGSSLRIQVTKSQVVAQEAREKEKKRHTRDKSEPTRRRPSTRDASSISVSRSRSVTERDHSSHAAQKLYLIRPQTAKSSSSTRSSTPHTESLASRDAEAVSVAVMDKLLPRAVAQVVAPQKKSVHASGGKRKVVSPTQQTNASQRGIPTPKSSSREPKQKVARIEKSSDAPVVSGGASGSPKQAKGKSCTRQDTRLAKKRRATKRAGETSSDAGSSSVADSSPPKKRKRAPKSVNHSAREKTMTNPAMIFANADTLTDEQLADDTQPRPRAPPLAQVPPELQADVTREALTIEALEMRVNQFIDDAKAAPLYFAMLQHDERLRVLRILLPRAFWGDFDVKPLLWLMKLNCRPDNDPLAYLVVALRPELIDTRRATHSSSAHSMLFHYALPLFLQRWGIMTAGTCVAEQWNSIGQHYGNWSSIVRWVEFFLVAPSETAQMTRDVLQEDTCAVSTEYQTRLVLKVTESPALLRRWWLARRQSTNVRNDTTGRSLSTNLIVPLTANWLLTILKLFGTADMIETVRGAIEGAENIPLATPIQFAPPAIYADALVMITNLLAAANSDSAHIRLVDKSLLAAQSSNMANKWIWTLDSPDTIEVAVQDLQDLAFEQTHASLVTSASTPSLKLLCQWHRSGMTAATLGVQVPVVNWNELRLELNEWASQFGLDTPDGSDNVQSTVGCAYPSAF